MIATIIISLFAILFAWIARFQKSKYGGLEAAFILLTIFMAIRYNFGSDYPVYLDIFLKIGSDVNLTLEHSEIGWVFLCRLFQPIGFFGMIIVLTVFEYFIIYRLIKRHVPKAWYWFSVFVFSLNTSYMLVFGSMMRQFLAMCIFILAVDYIIKKKWLISILLVLTASLLHTSALILLPFCFFGFLDISLSKKQAILWFGVYVLFYFIAFEFIGKYFFQILELKQFERYQYYLKDEKSELGTGLGFIFNMILYAFILLHQKYQSKHNKIIFILFSFSFFFYLFSDIAPATSRLGYYFSVFSIICYPLMLNSIRSNIWKYLLLLGYLLFIVKDFINFFDPSGIWHYSFYTYQTIFSAKFWM